MASFYDFLNKNSGGLASASSMLSSGIAVTDALDGQMSIGGSTASGALAGASAGAMLGPLGMLGGAAIGGLTSFFTAKKKQKTAEEAERKQIETQNKIQLATNKASAREILRNYPTEGVERPMYKKGGKVPIDYKAEAGEIVQFSPDNLPLTDQHGWLSKLSSDTAEIKGDKHSAPSGGVGMSGGERIFSDRVKVPKAFLKSLNKL